MINLSELIQKFESWPEPVQPPFTDIKVIGCCEEHEQEGIFLWYRNHHWKDLRDLILSKDRIIEHEIDPYEFKTISPNVFRYYMKGALSALAQEVERVSSFDELDFVVWQWINPYKKDLEKVKNQQSIVSKFSKEEVGEIIELIKYIERLDMSSLGSIEPEETIVDTMSYWQEIYTKI